MSGPTGDLLMAAAGGLVTEAAFPDRSWWLLAFVGVALLVGALRHATVGHSWRVGFVWAVALLGPHLFWAGVAAGPWAWVALVMLQAALVATGAAAWTLARRVPGVGAHPAWAAVVFGLVWVASEELRSSWPFGGFPWARLAFSQTEGPLLALAAFGGAPLVSAAVAIGGFAIATAAGRVLRRQLRAGLTAAALATAPVLIGAAIPLPSDQDSGTLTVAAVQGNVADPDLTGDARQRAVLANHVNGTVALLDMVQPGDLDVVLWPENATDIDPRTDGAAAASVEGAARAVDAPILVGTDRRADGGRYNDMVLWEAGSGPVAVYSKQRPAPFGEYIPLRGLVRLLSDEVDRIEVDMMPGDGSAVIDVPSPRLARDVRLATVICFEVAFDDLIREAVREGAELLVIPTNNASFGWTAESTQQLAMSRLRAVEHGRTAVQVSTVGVSAIIAPDGRVMDQTALFTADVMVADVPLRTTLSPADRVGDWPVRVASAAAVAATLAGLVITVDRRQRTRRRAVPVDSADRSAVPPDQREVFVKP